MDWWLSSAFGCLAMSGANLGLSGLQLGLARLARATLVVATLAAVLAVRSGAHRAICGLDPADRHWRAVVLKAVPPVTRNPAPHPSIQHHPRRQQQQQHLLAPRYEARLRANHSSLGAQLGADTINSLLRRPARSPRAAPSDLASARRIDARPHRRQLERHSSLSVGVSGSLPVDSSDLAIGDAAPAGPPSESRGARGAPTTTTTPTPTPTARPTSSNAPLGPEMNEQLVELLAQFYAHLQQLSDRLASSSVLWTGEWLLVGPHEPADPSKQLRHRPEARPDSDPDPDPELGHAINQSERDATTNGRLRGKYNKSNDNNQTNHKVQNYNIKLQALGAHTNDLGQQLLNNNNNNNAIHAKKTQAGPVPLRDNDTIASETSHTSANLSHLAPVPARGPKQNRWRQLVWRYNQSRIMAQFGADEASLLKWLRQRQDRFSSLKNLSFELINERPNRTINVCSDGPKILVLPNVSDIYYCYTSEQWIEKLWSDLKLSAFHYPIIVLNILIFLFGTTGNIFVCLSVKRNHQLRSVTNYFIVNLAFADFLVILICLPATVIWDLSLTWFFDTLPCKLIMFLQDVSISVSVLTLTAISIDRYYAICHPLKFKSSLSQAKRVIALIWLVSLATMAPDLIYLSAKRSSDLAEAGLDTVLYSDCNYDWSDSASRAFQFVKTILLYLLPFLLMFCAHYRILKVLHLASSMDQHHPQVTPTSATCGAGPLELGVDNCEPQHRPLQATMRHRDRDPQVHNNGGPPSVRLPAGNNSQTGPISNHNNNPHRHHRQAWLQVGNWRARRRRGRPNQRLTRSMRIVSNSSLEMRQPEMAEGTISEPEAPDNSLGHMQAAQLTGANGGPIVQDQRQVHFQEGASGAAIGAQGATLSAPGQPRPQQPPQPLQPPQPQPHQTHLAPRKVHSRLRLWLRPGLRLGSGPKINSKRAGLDTGRLSNGTNGSHQANYDDDATATTLFIELDADSNIRAFKAANDCLVETSGPGPATGPKQSSPEEKHRETRASLAPPASDRQPNGAPHRPHRSQSAASNLMSPNDEAMVLTMHNKSKLESRQKAAKMLTAIVVLFGICYLPVHLINFLRQFIDDIPQTDVTSTICMLAHCICYLNSAINPIIYNHMNSVFRAEFRKFLSCLDCIWRKGPPDPAQAINLATVVGKQFVHTENPHHLGERLMVANKSPNRNHWHQTNSPPRAGPHRLINYNHQSHRLSAATATATTTLNNISTNNHHNHGQQTAAGSPVNCIAAPD